MTHDEHTCSSDGILAGAMTDDDTTFTCGHGVRYPAPGGRIRTRFGVIIIGVPERPTPTGRVRPALHPEGTTEVTGL